MNIEELLESQLVKDMIEAEVQAAQAQVKAQYEEKIEQQLQEMKELKTAAMTESERAKFELEERERKIAEQEAVLQKEALKAYASRAILDYGLTMDALPLIMGEDELTTQRNAALLKRLIGMGSTGSTTHKPSYTPSYQTNIENPFAKATFNLTKQGIMLRDNPELARQLAAQAGVKLPK